MPFYVEAGALRDPSKDIFVPSWILPKISDAAMDKISGGKPAKKAKAKPEQGYGQKLMRCQLSNCQIANCQIVKLTS